MAFLSDYIKDQGLVKSPDVQGAFKALRQMSTASRDRGMRIAEILLETVPQPSAEQIAFGMIAGTPAVGSFARVMHNSLIQKKFSDAARDLAERWAHHVNETGICMNLPGAVLRQIMLASQTARLEMAFDAYINGNSAETREELALAWNEGFECIKYMGSVGPEALTEKLKTALLLAEPVATHYFKGQTPVKTRDFLARILPQ